MLYMELLLKILEKNQEAAATATAIATAVVGQQTTIRNTFRRNQNIHSRRRNSRYNNICILYNEKPVLLLS